jgi:hypothetical protein
MIIISHAARLTRFISQRKALFSSLNSAGTYYRFKETLKRAVVRIVRSRFAREAKADIGTAEGDSFVSELYVYLMRQVGGWVGGGAVGDVTCMWYVYTYICVCVCIHLYVCVWLDADTIPTYDTGQYHPQHHV